MKAHIKVKSYHSATPKLNIPSQIVPPLALTFRENNCVSDCTSYYFHTIGVAVVVIFLLNIL